VAQALDSGLQDILDPAATEILSSGGRYVAHNRHYNATFGHSGFHETDLPPEQALPRILRGLRFLARKLREIVDELKELGIVGRMGKPLGIAQIYKLLDEGEGSKRGVLIGRGRAIEHDQPPESRVVEKYPSVPASKQRRESSAK